MTIDQALLDRNLVTPEQLAEASALAAGQGLRVDRALVELGYVEEEDLLRVASELLAIPLMDLSNLEVDRETLACMPSKLVHQKAVFPVARFNGTLRVATSDPYDLYVFDELRTLTGLGIEPVLALKDQVRNLIKTYYGVGGDTLSELMGEEIDASAIQGGDEAEDLLKMAKEASVIKLVNEVFLEAIHERASDIHIEPYENDLKVRYRVDGVLLDAKVPPQVKRFQAAITSRIKIMAHLNIAEKRIPQDGRIKLQVGGRQIDIRVSVIPMLFGEGIVMRILDKASVLYTLPQLGMPQDTFAVFQKEIERPNGIILVTGPTGSGKTTTLYAALSAIVNGEIKVITIEDPVEYHLEGVNQIQIHPKVGLTFASGLRSILRHDPDVIMIGEIRDRETAEAAIQASLTGHLVLSTLHTNDACSAATRLIDMGVEPFLVASTLNAAMAQRLVRKICSECKEPYTPDAKELAAIPPDLGYTPGQTLWRGRGCRKCNHTGYRGRTGLYELMVLTEEVSEKIMARASSRSIENAARAGGLRLLREDGWLKVRAGITTIKEVIQSTKI